jgi:membrane protease subunit HflC
MKQGILVLGAIAALLLVTILSGAFFVVDESQQVVLTQFGRPKGEPITKPGLNFKIPFVQTANYFDKRFLEWDGDPNQLPTKDKRFIFVDTYARWRISDPLKFFQRLRDERGAQSRLDDILDGETRNTIASHNLIEVVRSSDRVFAISEDIRETHTDQTVIVVELGKEALEREVLANASARTTDLGIEILDFRFKRINYVQEVRERVYDRMISERQRIAEQFRSEGAGDAARISGEKELELKLITSEAYRRSQEIRGVADAEAADIYAEAYNRDPDFYRFLKTMEAYKVTLDADTVLVLGTDGEFLRYLERSK